MSDSNIELLRKATSLFIPKGAVLDHNSDDLRRLHQTYSILEDAQEAFLNKEITFEEYLEILEMGNVNIDHFLKTTEQNLETFKLL